jgi:hypothetical protein
VPGLHVYVVAPLAVSATPLPEHIVDEAGVTVTVGSGVTVTVTVWLALHEPLVPVTVYVLVDAGLAVTVAPVVALKPVPGAHVYDVAPLAVRLVLLPAQIVADGGVMVIVKEAFTVTVTVLVLEHEPLVPVMV